MGISKRHSTACSRSREWICQQLDTELSAADLEAVADRYRQIVAERTGQRHRWRERVSLRGPDLDRVPCATPR